MTTPQDTGEYTGESTGDIIFALAERQDRIQQYLRKKIERLDRRVTALEERGRS